MKQSVLIVNRAAGSGPGARLVGAIVERLAAGGYEAEPILTRAPGDATRLAREAAAAGTDAVFALGGDGTLRETAAGLLGTGVPLGPLPGGTANVLTLALGLPRNPVAAASVLARSAPRPIDVGLAGGRPFLMMASAGLDAALVADLHPIGKRWLGRVGIAGQGLAAWWSYPYPPIEVLVGGERRRASFVAVSNIALYGGPFRMVPEALPDDRRLDLLLFTGAGRAATFGFARDLLRGAHLRRPDVEVLPVGPAETVTISGAAEQVRVQVDGDPFPEPPPVTIALAAETLPVLAPGL